ncbi:hypothetical protein [Brevibacterium sp. HMSC07C04]|uniref:hypothetical protein n=1 Tax=Brevibacterium sp. HMSC07C04 TaxID=1581130 RepID=UPI0008A1E853|nr:hypothetical protein [Brevibacterium sp. HMSC07C04]OFS25312.1 hypothetical protein HMPREF3162_08810 [Brevibacterium sp. HMSC07C04]
MKKTILAPAVALSVGLTGAFGFAAAPAFASEGPSSETESTNPAADETPTDDTDADADETPVDDNKDEEGEGGEDESPAGDEAPADDETPSDEQPEDSTEGEESGEEAPAEDEESEEEAPAAEPTLHLSEKKIKASDFNNKKKGIGAAVSGLEPGTKVKFTVTGTSGKAKNVQSYSQTVEADEDGIAALSVAGITDGNAEDYVGKYTITAEFDGETLKDSFEVVSEAKKEDKKSGSTGGAISGDSSDSDKSDADEANADEESEAPASSGALPRTGQGLGALAAGAALLTVGGATVLLTRRNRKA